MTSGKITPQLQDQPLSMDLKPRKVILDVDPGISDALAVCLALLDPSLEVVAVTATGGNVTPQQASHNVQTIVEQLDAPRRPRIGSADEDQTLEADNHNLWGADGFCGAPLTCAELHNQHASAKVIAEEIRKAPGQVTVVAGGPLTNLAAVFKMEPALALQIGHLMIVGGVCAGPGDITAAAEFNIYCDVEAAKLVFNTPSTKTLLPLDVSSQAMLTFGLLNSLPKEETNAGRLLHALLPGAFQAFRQKLGLEGMIAPEVIGVAAILHPGLLTTELHPCDVETAGTIARGATIIDRRPHTQEQPNMDVAVAIDAEAAVDCILRSLQRTR